MKLPRSLKLFSQKNTSRNTPPAVQDSLDVDNSAKLASDKYKLLPVNDIAINEEGTPYQFSATSTDPFFVVDRNPAEIITPGWYCIFMHINNAGGHQVAN